MPEEACSHQVAEKSDYTVIREVHCKTAKEFLDHLRPEHSIWEESDRKGLIERPWIYRGHGNADWELKASACRHSEGPEIPRPLIQHFQGKAKKKLDRKAKPESPEERNRVQSVYAQVAAFHQAVRDFAELSDQVGHPVEGMSEVWSGEDYLEKGGWDFPAPSSVVALAQHHGIPTHLLDWTKDPFIAAYFAACSAEEDRDIAVWGFDSSINFDHTNLEVFRAPYATSEYLRAQRGVFLCHRKASVFFVNDGQWPDLVDPLETRFGGKCRPLVKITCPSSRAEEILQLLWASQISLAYLMPDRRMVAEALKTRWRWGKWRIGHDVHGRIRSE